MATVNTMLDALKDAKRRRAEEYAYKDRRILSMLEDGVSKKDIEATLRVSHRYIQQVIARSKT